MRRLLIAAFVTFGLALLAAPSLEAQGFQWGLYDGTAATPPRLRGNINATVTRVSTGYYKITFTNPVFYVQVTSLTGGVGGDATPSIASVIYDTNDQRVIYLNIYGIFPGAPPDTSNLKRVNGRFSIEVRR